MHRGLLRRDPAGVDEALHERVVGRDLFELAAAEAVDAGVADVGDRDLVVDADDAAHRRAHPRELVVFEDGLGEQGVGRDESGLQREGGIVGGGVALVDLADAADGDRGGDVATGVAAHAVGDDEEIVSGVSAVLVVGANLADVRDGCALLGLRHAYRRNSKVVVPIVTGVLSGTRVGSVTRVPSRKVPLVESRSWMTQPSSHSSRRAWWVDV